jgi:ABC-2 type transport system permease protein
LVRIARQRVGLDLGGAVRDPLLVMLVALMPMAALVFSEPGTPRVVLASLPAMTAGTVAGLLMVVVVARERFDGTLTRLRALPHGITGFVLGRMVTMLALVGVAVAATGAAPGAQAGLAVPGGLSGWAALAAGALLGAGASAVLGLVAAALLPSGNVTGAGSLLAQSAILGMVFVPANLEPVGEWPALSRFAVQALPAGWSGHLVRQGLLGEGAAAGGPGGAWSPAVAVIVLSVWIVVGGLLAARLLSRGARRGDGKPIPVEISGIG